MSDLKLAIDIAKSTETNAILGKLNPVGTWQKIDAGTLSTVQSIATAENVLAIAFQVETGNIRMTFDDNATPDDTTGRLFEPGAYSFGVGSRTSIKAIAVTGSGASLGYMFVGE